MRRGRASSGRSRSSSASRGERSRSVRPALRGRGGRRSATAMQQAARAGCTGAEGQAGQGGPSGAATVAPASGGAARVTRAQHAPGPSENAGSTARRPGNRPHILYPTRRDSGEYAGGFLRGGGVGCRGMDGSGVERGTEGTRVSMGVYRPGGVWRGRRNESRWVTGWLGAGISARGGLGGVEAVLRQ